MSDWRTRLREADPERFAASRPEDVGRVRASVLSAVGTASAPRRVVLRPLAFVAAMSMMVLAAVGIAWQNGARVASAPPPDRSLPVALSDAGTGTDEAAGIERGQLQFATPGGTRIIWVFDPSFELKGMVP